MCIYYERHGCSYLAYNIILLPEKRRERVRNGVWAYLHGQIVLSISMVGYGGRDLGSGSN